MSKYGKDKEVKEVKSSELVDNIMNTCDNVVESPSKELYVDVVVQAEMFVRNSRSFLPMLKVTY
jgi:hypothetical protein